jgi:hypothetical protein
MAGKLTLVIDTHGDDDAVLQARIHHAEKAQFARAVQNYLNGLAGGVKRARVRASVSDAFASQTVTCDQSAAVDGTDELKIGSVTLAVEAAPANEDQFEKGADDAEFADNLAAAINAHSVLSQVVRAESDGVDEVTVTCLVPGLMGNQIALTETGSGFALGGAALAGGTAENFETYDFGVAAE